MKVVDRVLAGDRLALARLLTKIENGEPVVNTATAIESLRNAWADEIRRGDVVSRNYLHRLVKRIDVYDNEIRLIPKEVLVE